MNILFPYMARWKAVNWSRYHSLLTELSRMGHEIFILQPPSIKSQETNFQEIDVELPENLHLIDVPVPKVIWNRTLPYDKIFKKGLYSIYCKRMVDRIILKEQIDTMLLYNIPQYFLSRTKKCKVIFDVADDYLPMLAQELGLLANKATLGVAKYVFNDMLRHSDVLLTVSRVLADDLDGEVTVIPNGVDPSKANAARSIKLAFNSTRPVVGFIGAFEYFIDFDLILKTAELLPNVTFLLVGCGREFNGIETMVKERDINNIVMTGGVPHQEVFAYIEKMDICLNIFKKIRVSHAACPIKMFEYMIMKKPVISTRLEEVENMAIDSICYADNEIELKKVIEDLLANNNKSLQIGKNNCKTVYDKYTWRQAAVTFNDIMYEQDNTHRS